LRAGEAAVAEGVLEVAAKEEQHVAGDVQQAAVQDYRRDDGGQAFAGREAGRDECPAAKKVVSRASSPSIGR